MSGMRNHKNNPWKVYQKETPSSVKCCPWQREHTGTSSSEAPALGLVTSFNRDLCFEGQLRLEHLQFLEEAFANHIPLDFGSPRSVGIYELARGHRPVSGSGRQAGSMSREEFQATFSAMLGSEHWSTQTEQLFNKADASCDGYVNWNRFCTYMLLYCREKDDSTRPRDALLTDQPMIRRCLYNKQETNTRVLAVLHPLPLRFVTVSRDGVLTIWNRNLNPLKSLELSGDSGDEGGHRRRLRYRTTDAVYLPNVHKIAVATSSRDLHFFDVSTGNVFEEFVLFGINNIPTSLSYWFDTKSPGHPSLLLWGDDEGAVSLLWFLRPERGLLEMPFSNGNGCRRIFMQDIVVHSRLASYKLIPAVHQEPINRIAYDPHADLIITSSGSASTSVVIIDASQKKKSYIWKINKGVKCFDFSRSLNLLVTAGMDSFVRLWNQYATTCPMAVLSGHHKTVLDVAIYEPLAQIFSYSMDAVLKVWDIVSQHCLRTLLLKFPCVLAGHALEHGNFPFLLLPAAPHVLLVSCRDSLGLLRLQHRDSGGVEPLTHSTPLTGALYNPLFKQVVTGCAGSSVAVWDVETGTKSLNLKNAHGQEEITCIAFDTSKHQFITGARNGTIKVWSMHNGCNTHKLEAVAVAEVTGVVSLPDNKLLAVGWSQQIAQYSVTNPNDIYVQADMSWKSGQLHKDDILAVDYCPALGLLATGSFDGEMIIWNLSTQRPLLYLQRALCTRGHHDVVEDTLGKTSAKAGLIHPSSCCKRTSEEGRLAPVDKLLFLQHRARGGQCRSRPLLVSSEAGHLCWWSVTGHRHGVFYAPEKADVCVLGLSSDQENQLLVSGDTAGSVQVWDISQFALQAGDQPSLDRPPLLHSWRAHVSTVVSVELLVHSEQLFVISASADRTARLWTCDGRYVGWFGQEQKWSLCDPTTYQHPRGPWGQQTEATEDENDEEEEEMERGITKRSQGNASASDQASSDPNVALQEGGSGLKSQLARSSCVNAAGVGSLSPPPVVPWETQTTALSPSDSPAQRGNPSDSPPRTEHTKIALGQVEKDLQRKAAARQECRKAFAHIDVNKLSRGSNICAPFQALSIQECQEVPYPGSLPLTPWKMILNSGREADLSLLSLTSHSPDDQGGDDV